jgi:hypothetical protein
MADALVLAMRILKYLVTFSLLASIAGCYVEERRPSHPGYHHHHHHDTVIIR